MFFWPFYSFSFGHCNVCSSSIYSFWLLLWYCQFFLLSDSYRSYVYQHDGCP